LVDGGGGTAHRERRRCGGGSPVGHEVGNNIAKVHSLRELEWGKRRREGTRFAHKEAHERCASKKRNKRRGGPVWGQGRKQGPAGVPGKEGHIVHGGEANAAPCHGHASTAHVGPATDGFRRTHSDSDPTNVERSPAQGQHPISVPNTPDH
jgi:hypothetical protein